MEKNLLDYKYLPPTLNAISIGLVIVGIFDFLVLRHNREHSNIYFASALFLLFFAFFLRRLHVKKLKSGSAGEALVDKNTLILAFVYMVAFLMFFAESFTNLFKVPVVLDLSVIFIMALMGAVIFRQYKTKVRPGYKLTAIHKFGIAVAVGVLLLFIYSLMADSLGGNLPQF